MKGLTGLSRERHVLRDIVKKLLDVKNFARSSRVTQKLTWTLPYPRTTPVGSHYTVGGKKKSGKVINEAAVSYSRVRSFDVILGVHRRA